MIRAETKIGIITPWFEIVFYYKSYQETILPRKDDSAHPDFIADMSKQRDDLDMIPQKNRLEKTG